ncbi:transcriptional regulator FilR1 domain-containing protein [Halorubrum saccharovorum]|uniref:transcriptional regulator FilR1 domain-containing protein n=1 Tax=Halorubrum saccharovorum TaxID=2248 RepID=UPI001267AFBF|nr:hypothetical protein [Halorubrum saccharovorum]
MASATDLISSLNQAEQVPRFIFRGANISMADPKAPEACLQPIIQILEKSTHFRTTSRVAMTYGVNKLCKIVKKRGISVEVCAQKKVIKSMSKLCREEMKELYEVENVKIYSISDPVPYSLWIAETPSNTQGGFVVHLDGAVKGILSNDSPQAIDWMEMSYDKIQEGGKLVNESTIQNI